MQRRPILWVGLIAILLSPSCGEKENPMGEGLVDPRLASLSDSSVGCSVTEAVSFQFICPSSEEECQRGPGRADMLVLGTGYGYRAVLAVSFASVPVDSESVIDSAWVRFTAARLLEGAPANLTVHALLDTLREGEVLFGDSLTFDPTPLPVTHEYDETGLRIDLAEVVDGWHASEGLRGLAIASHDAGPSLVFFYSSEAGAISDTTSAPPLLSVYRHVEGDTASGLSLYAPGEDTYFLWWDPAVDSLSAAENRITIAKGFASRSLLKADVSLIPAEATINRARLILHVDVDQSVYDSLETRAHLVTGAWDGPRTEYQSLSYGGGRVESGVDSAEIDVTQLVQVWTGELVANDGFLLKTYGEVESIDFVRVFAPSYPDSSLRPVLQVQYSVPPPPWYH